MRLKALLCSGARLMLSAAEPGGKQLNPVEKGERKCNEYMHKIKYI